MGRAWSPREVRDLPIFDADTILMVWRARVACPSCGPRLEALDWLEPYARVVDKKGALDSLAKIIGLMKDEAENFSDLPANFHATHSRDRPEPTPQLLLGNEIDP